MAIKSFKLVGLKYQTKNYEQKSYKIEFELKDVRQSAK